MQLEKISKKIESILEITEDMIYEREELMRLILLAVFTRENIFLLGPPGTGKSLVYKIIEYAFPELKSFRCLLRETSRYSDIFGEEVKVDSELSERITEGKLPKAELALIDETFKGSDDILNSMLTILNEKIFDDSYKTVDVPLFTAIGASNELPKRKFLAAIFERFPLRIEVPNVKKKTSFESLVNDEMTEIVKGVIPSFTKEDLDYIKEKQKDVTNSDEYVELFWESRKYLMKILNTSDEFEGTAYEVSGRTTKKLGNICRTSATINRRTKTDISDMFIAKYVLWKNLKERKIVYTVLDKIVFGDKFNILENIDILLSNVDGFLDELENNIEMTLCKRKILKDELEFDNFISRLSPKIENVQKQIKVISEKIIFFEESEIKYQKISNNIFLHAYSIVSWRAMSEKIIYKEQGSEFGVLIEREGDLYIDMLTNKKNYLRKSLKLMLNFKNYNSDYFDYTNNCAHSGNF